jgi:tRNA (cmo5U34)-methyltransferase
LVSRALLRAPATRFWLSDPSPAMLALARARLPVLPDERFKPWRSEELQDAFGRLDVITAVQSHHYGDLAAQERAVSRCHALLGVGGVLVVFENVRAATKPATKRSARVGAPGSGARGAARPRRRATSNAKARRCSRCQ